MLNWSIMSRWQNWLIVTLMFAIPATGLHFLINHVEKDVE
jgi:hypothetical protein